MQILDLRQIQSRTLDLLFQEEAEHWRRHLYWDYRPSQQLIRKFIDSHSLAGYAAFKDKQPIGYGFYVFEEQKGLIGGLYASSSDGKPHTDTGKKLLLEMFESLRGAPFIERVEAQLMPFGASLDDALAHEGFRLYRRQFMHLDLNAGAPAGQGGENGLRLDPWNDRCLESCAKLIQRAYTDHVDSEINDQYRSEPGAMKFLRNIILLPGCGQFLPEASFIARLLPGDRPVGMVLTSTVAPRVGHTTQICVLPGYQKNGLGRKLMEASLTALHRAGYDSLTLTVTAVNANAVRLYENLGFRSIRTFAAGVWTP